MMGSFTLLAYYHGFGGGLSGGLAHTVMSIALHALIYSVIFRALAHLTLVEELVLVAAVLLGIALWGRGRGRNGW